eukprot:TRINITY_DN2319_c0_g1_i2.p1 TRINITY_DN2319_c0_g1~~TRINITY_DN2319_c0_g1_i2.p1  ORF type:complete len:180 (-),score=63.61 TRINITY_DN2319_c0_g1_i2:144-683(-)
MRFTKAKDTFYNWADAKITYGLNFSNVNDANTFATAVFNSISALSAPPVAQPPPPQPQPPQPQPPQRTPMAYPSAAPSPSPSPSPVAYPSAAPTKAPSKPAPPPGRPPVAQPPSQPQPPPPAAKPKPKPAQLPKRPEGPVSSSRNCGKYEPIKTEVLTSVRDDIYDFRDEILKALAQKQ